MPVDQLVKRVGLLEEEKGTFSDQLAALKREHKRSSSVQNLELKDVELRRLNKELEMHSLRSEHHRH